MEAEAEVEAKAEGVDGRLKEAEAEPKEKLSAVASLMATHSQSAEPVSNCNTQPVSYTASQLLSWSVIVTHSHSFIVTHSKSATEPVIHCNTHCVCHSVNHSVIVKHSQYLLIQSDIVKHGQSVIMTQPVSY